MPRNFVLNDKYIESGFNKPLVEKTSVKFDLISRRKATELSEDDNFILLHETQKEDFEFQFDGIITNVGKAIELPISEKDQLENEKRRNRKQDPLPREYKREIDLYIQEKLQGINKFNDYVYSLLTIENYKKPITHFEQKNRLINNQDYETIKNGWIYISRTAFGKIINSLPYSNRLEFTLFVMKEFNQTTFTKLDYNKLLIFLFEYIDTHILSQGILITESFKLLENLNDPNIPLNDIGFILDSTSSNSDSLKTQSDYFNVLFDFEKQVKMIDTIKQDIISNAQEERFQKLFQKRTWPLYLN